MTKSSPKRLCTEEQLSSLLGAVRGDSEKGLRALNEAAALFPNDPRIHLLKGSLLARREDFVGARASMRRAVDLAPDYAVARFQLGFLLLTSGEAYAAQEIWGPLHGLPRESYLRCFVDGLCHLVRDEFIDAIALLKNGIAANHENPAMNGDMQLIIETLHKKIVGLDDGLTSPVDQLLQQSAFKRRH